MRALRRSRLLPAGAALLVAFGLAACSSRTPATRAPGAPLRVVAAENFWGSIAGQLGGDRVRVTSIISSPDTDPHEYEPTPADARTLASAQYVIENGVGYDPWVDKLLAANPKAGRIVLDVGDLVGVKDGGNPHRWYSPADVARVIGQITADYTRLDPDGSRAFDERHAAFTTTAMGAYNRIVADIRAKYAGTPVGASESVFAPMAEGLGLDLVTPASFLEATSEGTEPTAGDKATIDRQIKGRQIKVYVSNSQNSTPDVKAQVAEASRAGIPTTTITETLTPAGTTFQAWQVAQLEALESALAKVSGT